MAKKKDDKEPQGNQRFQSGKRVCQNKMTAEARENCSLRLFATLRERDEAVERKKAAVSALNAEIKEIDGEIRECRSNFSKGTESVVTECVWCFDWDKGRIIVTRADTMEVVEDLPMTDEQKQSVLDGVPLDLPGAVDEDFGPH